MRTQRQLAPAPARVRVDQLGYLPRELKRVGLMTSRPIDYATYTVVDRDGVVRPGP